MLPLLIVRQSNFLPYGKNMRLMSLPSFPPKKMFTIQNKLTETYYFPICLSQSCTDFLAAVRLFCAVLPRTASPFSSVAPLHVERILLSVPASIIFANACKIEFWQKPTNNLPSCPAKTNMKKISSALFSIRRSICIGNGFGTDERFRSKG